MNGNQLITKHSAKFDTVEKSKRPGVLATLRGPVTGWKPNRNGRTYSRDLWVKALNSDYVKEQVALNHFVGEADHPEERLEPVIQNMSHAMRDFEFDDANQEVIATIDILDTPCGNMLKTLYDYSGALSFSTRGSGDVLEDGEVDPETYQLFAIDAVLRPSYATATVRNLLTESESLHKNKDVKKVLESYSGKKRLDESVVWDYFNIFHDINDKYLPDSGEGDNMATQTVTAVNKLVYKWYNDGDVYDNSTASGLDGWGNDLSDYANWLAKNIDGCKDILDRIFEIHYGDNGAYEDLLKDLANNCLDENLLSGLATQPKEGSIYDCPGDYSFDESRNYDEEYDESENLEEVVRVYDDEKDYSSELEEVFNIVGDFINNDFKSNTKDYLRYSGSTDRVDSSKVFDGLASALGAAGYLVSKDRVSHAHNIGNNNAYEIFKDSECIGFLNVNSGMYGEAYVYVENLSNGRVGGAWELHSRGTSTFKEGEELGKVNTKTDLSKKYIFNDKGVERTVTEVEPLAYRDGYKFREILDNGSVGKVVHTMSKADFDSLKELTEDADSVVAIPDDVKEAVETEVYDDRNIDVRSSMFKGNDFVVEARNELSEDEFTKIVDRIQYHFNNYGIVYDSIEDDGNNIIAIDCGMSASAYEEYKANSDDYTLNDESFTMYNADTDKTVRVYKDGGKWVDEDGNRYMGYLTKSDVKKYFKGNWVELDESEQLNEYGDTKDYSEDIQKLFKKWFKENADLGIRAWQAMTDSYHLDIETMDKGEGSERRKLYKVVNNSPFVEVEDWADEIGEYIADNLHSLKYIKHTFNDKSFFSDDETAGDITWYFVQQIGMPDFGDNIFDSEKLSEDNEPKTTKEFRIIDTETGKILKVFKDDEESKGYEEMRAMGEELKKAGKEDNLIYKEFRVKNKPERLKEDSTWAEIMIDRALESGVRKTQYQDVDGVKDQYYVVANFQDVGTRADARKYCKAQGWSAVNDSTLDKGVMYRYPLVIYIPADKLPDGVQVINEAGVNLDVSAGVDLPDDAVSGIISALPALLASDKPDFDTFCEENYEAINNAYDECKASDLGISVEEYWAMDEPVDPKYWEMVARDMYEDSNSLVEDANDSQEYINKFNELYNKYWSGTSDDEKEQLDAELVSLLTNAPVGTVLYRLYKDTSSGWTSYGSYSDTRTVIHEYLKSGENEWTINGRKKSDMDDARLSVFYNPGEFMTKEEAEAQKKEQSKNDTSSRREIVNVGTDSAGNPVGKSTNTVTYPNREVESVDFLDDYFAYHKGNF